MLPRAPGNGASKGEARMFRYIQSAPDSAGYYCLHSVGLARHQRKAYAEADFVVIGPEGVFCLELKNGRVSRRDGLWEIGWAEAGRSYSSPEGPFRQAHGAMRALMAELASRVSSGTLANTLFGWGVLFPDIAFDIQDPEWDPRQVFDARDEGAGFVSYVQRLSAVALSAWARSGRTAGRLVDREISEILECFRRDFDLVPLLGKIIRESREELAALSQEQYAALGCILNPDNPRVICLGAAGTGKTILALEAARRFQTAGLSTLYVCFNRVLARHVARHFAEASVPVIVRSWHEFMRESIRDAGMEQELLVVEGHATDTRILYEEFYPDLFERAVLQLAEDGRRPRFDAVVIDEAQDILTARVVDSVEWIVEGGIRGGRWCLMLDPGPQARLYGRMESAVLDTLKRLGPTVVQLDANLRNPRGIVREMCAVVRMPEPRCARQLVSRVDYVECADAAETRKKIRSTLVDLLRQGVSPAEVVLLSGCRLEESALAHPPVDIGKRFVSALDAVSGRRDADSFVMGSVAGFKGLEGDVVLLTDVPTPNGVDSWESAVLYVGMTRAVARLFVFVSEAYLQARGKLAAGAVT